MAKKDPAIDSCASCKCPLGEKAGEWPMRVTVSTSGSDPDKPDAAETWCPQDFVYVRAPAEPGRWRSPHLRAAQCAVCKLKSVDMGHGKCPGCGAHLGVMALPPKPGGSVAT